MPLAVGNRTCRFAASGSRTRRHAFTLHGPPPCGNVTPKSRKTYPLPTASEKGGVLNASETITGFHCCFGSDAVLVVNGGCSQQCGGKPDLYRQHRELQPDTAALHRSSPGVY